MQEREKLLQQITEKDNEIQKSEEEVENITIQMTNLKLSKDKEIENVRCEVEKVKQEGQKKQM